MGTRYRLGSASGRCSTFACHHSVIAKNGLRLDQEEWPGKVFRDPRLQLDTLGEELSKDKRSCLVAETRGIIPCDPCVHV